MMKGDADLDLRWMGIVSQQTKCMQGISHLERQDDWEDVGETEKA
jgi:hypothetical protein